MEGDGNLRGELDSWNEIGSIEKRVVAMNCTGERVEGKVERKFTHGSVLHGREAHLRRIAQDHAVFRIDLQITAVIEAGDVETVVVKVIGEKNRAAHIGVDGVSVTVGKGQAEGEGGKLAHVGDEAPAVIPEGLDFQLLLVAALVLEDVVGVPYAAILNTVVGVFDRGVFKRACAELGALGGTPTAEIFETHGGIHPSLRGPIEGIASDETLAIAVADDGNEKAGLADMFPGRSGSEWQPDKRNAVKAEVGVNECHAFVDGNLGFGCIELPGGVIRIAYREPGMTNDVVVRRKAFDLFGLEKQGVLSDKDRGIGATFELYSAANVFEGASTGADVEFSLIGFDVLVVVIELNVARSACLRSDGVVLDVVGSQAKRAIADVDIAVGKVEVALLGLGTTGRNFGDGIGDGRNARLLRVG